MNQAITIPVNLSINKMSVPSPHSSLFHLNGNLFCIPSFTSMNYNNKLSSINPPCFNSNELINTMIINDKQKIGNLHYTQQNKQNNDILGEKTGNVKKSKQFFTTEEDDMLKKLVKHFGTKNWFTISLFMKDRSAKQCRDRYINYLTPGVFQGQWTKEEDKLLIKLYNEFGPKWSLIKSKMPNRSSNAIKNRWSYFLHRNYKSNQAEEENEEPDKKKDDNEVNSSSNKEEIKSFFENVADFDFEYQSNDVFNNWFSNCSDAEWI